MVLVTAWFMQWPLAKAAYLAPIIVIGFAAAIGLLILWGKVAAQSLRQSRHPKLVLGLWIGGIGLLVLLSFLGVQLPGGHR